jgi:predicted O-methyltransferase YrrM
MYAHSENEVRARLVGYGITRSQLRKRFTFVEGYFPDGFARYSGGPIALLHIDVDLYQSNKVCLEWFEPLVAPGGVIAFDEYRNPPGSERRGRSTRRTTRHPRGPDQESLVSGQVGAGRFGPVPHRKQWQKVCPGQWGGHVGGRDRG